MSFALNDKIKISIDFIKVNLNNKGVLNNMANQFIWEHSKSLVKCNIKKNCKIKQQLRKIICVILDTVFTTNLPQSFVNLQTFTVNKLFPTTNPKYQK